MDQLFNEQFRASIIGAEGISSYVYQDSEGIWTIGVGINVDKDHGGGLLPEEIEFITNNRLNLTVAQANRQFPWLVTLNQARQNVIYEMLYQLGLGKLLGFKKFLAAAEAQDWGKAAYEMEVSKWYGQTPKRVRRLQQQLISGAWVAPK